MKHVYCQTGGATIQERGQATEMREKYDYPYLYTKLKDNRNNDVSLLVGPIVNTVAHDKDHRSIYTQGKYMRVLRSRDSKNPILVKYPPNLLNDLETRIRKTEGPPRYGVSDQWQSSPLLRTT